MGGTSIAADDLACSVSQIAPGTPSLLSSGSSYANGGIGLWFGDGLRCAGGQIRRHGVQFFDGTGSAGWGSGLAGTNGWSAGDTRHLQVWYRDNGGPCSSGFNTSNGLTLNYVP